MNTVSVCVCGFFICVLRVCARARLCINGKRECERTLCVYVCDIFASMYDIYVRVMFACLCVWCLRVCMWCLRVCLAFACVSVRAYCAFCV